MELPDKSVGPQPSAQKKVKEPIIPAGSAVAVSRPARRRVLDFLIAESPKAVSKKIASDVIVPRIKQGLEEALNGLIAGMFWGGNRPPGMSMGHTMRGGGSVYSALSSGGSSLMAARQATEVKQVSYEDLVFPTQDYAEQVLANMIDLLNEYRVVAVGDLNDLVGNSSKPSDNAYGWNNLEGVRISKDRDGFKLELPRPTLI